MRTLMPDGLLFPESVLHSVWFQLLAAFVAINTIMYVVLAVAKMLPKLYVNDYLKHAERRSQTRSIYPDGRQPPG